ncbi:MAG: 6-hydroxymethylpterin diphosphokinase MptE-like protein [Pseudomonadota bacterium]
MLKYINYQLDTDDTRQAKLERDISAQINQRFKANMSAFAQHIPSVVPMIEQHAIQQYSVFCTRQGELNIVDFATGRVWYSETPFAEVADEVQSFCAQAPYIDLSVDKAAGNNSWPTEPLPARIDLVMMFGLGLGYQLNELLQNARVKYLIVYEPSLDTLLCSVQANDWAELFETASALGTQVFLQLGNDGSSVQDDLAELLQVQNIQRVYLYRHRFHPVMDKVLEFLQKNTGQPEQLFNASHQFTAYDSFYDYVSERNANVLGNQQQQNCQHNTELYEKNLDALKKYYPSVHKVIAQHDSSHWRLVIDSNQNKNLYHSERNALFYDDVDSDSSQLVDYFYRHPFKDDVILGQKTGRKLSSFLHFQYVEKLQPVISKIYAEAKQLPDTINSLIIFGIGLGKHIELISQQKTIENLYICEPNLDFFKASLYVTDWTALFEKAEHDDTRIYLNLGGDGSEYFYDLMAQFYKVGAYSIADTYMLSAYYNEQMQKAISELRAQLKVVLAIGEYYDHAKFGIAHTYASLKNHHRFMRADTSSAAALLKELPVFIIGNGPSLDQTLDYLKQYREQVLLISCGTALKALHRSGIRPDFHAEVEQNRATYDWVTQVNDPEYLSQIRLISVNGMHPDTAALFRETLLAFKDGESSSYVFNGGLKKQGYELASLSYAYPTVTNLVVNYMLRLGARLIYLFGVDLGFVDVRYHHSQHSAYFKSTGEEIYNYQQAHGGAMPAPGNFRPVVFTKAEFDVSRKLMEQALKKVPDKLEVYNCSDGVKIKGATTLHADNILLPDNQVDKEHLLTQVIEQAYYSDLSQYAELIYQKFDQSLLESSLTEWLAILDKPVQTKADALALIKQQWTFLRSRATVEGDLTFCLLYGSSNYISGIMTKLASSMNEDDDKALASFHEIVGILKSYLSDVKVDYFAAPLASDKATVNYLFGS